MMNELKTTSDKVKAALALALVVIILSGCSNDYYVTPRHMEDAERVCANNDGLKFIVSNHQGTELRDGNQTTFIFSVNGECHNGVKFNYKTKYKLLDLEK